MGITYASAGVDRDSRREAKKAWSLLKQTYDLSKHGPVVETPYNVLYPVGNSFFHAAVYDAAANWSYMWVARNVRLDPDVKAAFLQAYPGQTDNFPEFIAVTPDNIKDVAARSGIWRKQVRGALAAAIS